MPPPAVQPLRAPEAEALVPTREAGVNDVDDVIERCALLKPQAQLWALSNTNLTHLAHFETAYPFFGLFKGILASHELGLRKPDPRIYRLACERMACRPEEVFFIDDSEANVQAARSCGLTAFHYRFSDPELRQALRQAGFSLP